MYKGRWFHSLCPGETKAKTPIAIFNSWCKQDMEVIVLNHISQQRKIILIEVFCFCFFPVSLTILFPPLLTSLETVISSEHFFWVVFFLITLNWIKTHHLLFGVRHIRYDCQVGIPRQVSRWLSKHHQAVPSHQLPVRLLGWPSLCMWPTALPINVIDRVLSWLHPISQPEVTGLGSGLAVLLYFFSWWPGSF